MKNDDPRFKDTRIIESSGNVFEDLGFDKAEAQVMKLRVEMMSRLRTYLQDNGFTQVKAAAKLRTTQPRVSALFKGAWKEFSLDTLMTFAGRAGFKPKIELGIRKSAQRRAAA